MIDFSTIASDARTCASDTTGDAARLWTTIATLADQCSSLTERLERQENRRVGRPPKNR